MLYVPQVVQVFPGDDFTVYVWFSDGSVKLADIKPFIERGGVFSQIADSEVFSRTLTVMNHAVAWDVLGTRNPSAVIDLDPCSTYEKATPVEDPLLDVA